MTPNELKSLMGSLPSEDKAVFDRWLFEQSWQSWLTALYPHTMWDFERHHAELWEWLWRMPADSPPPFAAIWPRGGAKSTNAELGVVMVGARGLRKYCLYVCNTQDQADDHVANIGALLDHPTLATVYPGMSEPALGKFGPKGWRRNRLRTASGFTIDAIGLDTAARGAKLDDYRPDLMVFDDIDSDTDGPNMVEKKIQQMTRKLLPAGASNLAVLLAQNLVHENSIFSRLAGVSEENADYLQDCIISGPFPALYDAAYEQTEEGKWRIVAGTPLWSGQSLASCNALLSKIGYIAFRVECQQEVHALPGGMFDAVAYRHCAPHEVPPIIRRVVWVDPAVTSTDKSDRHAIQVDGLGVDNKIYRFYSFEERATPLASIMLALRLAVQYQATYIGIETDQGGETWTSVFNEAVRLLMDGYEDEHGVVHPGGFDATMIGLVENKASGLGNSTKVFRAQQMLAAYMEGRFVHVIGSHAILEKALSRFPRSKPYDLVDCAFWSWFDLDGNPPFTTAVGGYQDRPASGAPRGDALPMAGTLVPNLRGNHKWP
jgi:hypothetical protein